MKIDFDTVYHIDLTGKVKFGDLPEAVLNRLFQDGRVASKFLEHYVPMWFPELKFVDKRGYDHVDEATGKVKYDLKGFTKYGARFLPSNMVGGNRVINLVEAHAHAQTIDYIFSDVINFPKVRIQFRKGTDLTQQFPSCQVKLEELDQLFNGVKHVTVK